jgi:sialidase-1
LIAVYDVRYNDPVDLQADVDVGMSRSTDGGKTWESMKIIMDMGEWGGKPQEENGIGDPSVLVDRTTGTIWVAAVWAHGTPGKRNWFSSRPGLSPSETSQFMVVRSDDDGLSWSPPINLTPMLKDPKWYLLLQGPGSGITLTDGTLIFPAQFKDEQEMPHSTIVWSKDHGESWKIGSGAKPNTTEAQVIELDDGSIMLNMRDNRKGSRSVYISDDLGSSWKKHPTSRSALAEPVCNAALIKGRFQLHGEERSIVLFANPNSIQGRNHMTIKASLDDGNTWPEAYWLLIDQLRGRGYPNMTQIDDRHVGILYEGSQADLVFEKISLDEIINKEEVTDTGARTGESPYFDTRAVFNPLSDGMAYHNYRIPSFLVTKNNVLLAVAEGREELNLDHAKNDLVLMRSSDGGDNWEDPVIIAEAGDNVTMNPVMVQAENGMVIVTYIYFPEKYHTREMSSHGVKLVEPGLSGDHIQRFFVITSEDDGVSWSKPHELTSVVKRGSSSLASICGPGTGITITRGEYKGRVIIPMQEQITEGKKKETYLYSLYSDDHGRSWNHGEFAAPEKDGSGGEVQMVELTDGSLMLSARNSSGFRRVAFSGDGGQTWSTLKKEKALTDTGCMSPLLRYRWPDGNDPGVIIHVGVTDRVEGRRRGKAVFCLSYDDGKTWPLCKVFHEGTFDYSSLAILPDGSIGMLAEYDFDGERAKIKLARFNLQWIEEEAD